MPERRTVTLGKLAEMAEMLRASFQKDVVQVEYRKGSHVGMLSQLRFATNERGRPTKRTIECLDGGTKRYFDKNYDLDITALIVNGNRAELQSAPSPR